MKDVLRIINFWEVVTLGKKTTNNNDIAADVNPVSPSPDSPCIIMYTSGINIVRLGAY